MTQESIMATAAVLYEELCNSRNVLRRTNAKWIYAVCNQMELDNVEITVAGVLKRCHNLFDGKPASSTVTNQGSALGEYIRRRRLEQSLPEKWRSAPENASISQRISDPVIANQVQLLEDSICLLRRENTSIRALIKNLGIDIDGMLKGIPNLPSKSTVSNAFAAQSTENVELQPIIIKLMDHLVSRHYGAYRGRLTINAKEVLNAKEYSAFCRASGLSEELWVKRFGSTP